MKNDGFNILLTKLFLLTGTVGASWLKFAKDMDLILGLALKLISIISFLIVIIINLPAFVKTIKTYAKKIF